MTRQIILDTETTGLDPALGHRIIEIGCVEINNRRRSQQVLQHYLNPDRAIDEGALHVHGISNAFLQDKPRFSDIVEELMSFLRDSELIIHNASFDVAFLNAELERLGKGWNRLEEYCQVFDTLTLARKKHPGQKNSLDALCKRYQVNNAHRKLHGALLDAHILTDVYLAMTEGQTNMTFTEQPEEALNVQGQANRPFDPNRLPLKVIKADAGELQAHQHCLERINKKSNGHCIWLQQTHTEKDT